MGRPGRHALLSGHLAHGPGPETNLPNLLVAITLAKSWAARAETATYPAQPKEDYRRAVRLGRLVLQGDVTLISNLVGLVCVRIGARGPYEHARREGDAETMLAACLALNDADTIPQIAAERITRITVPAVYRWHWSRPLSPTVRATDEQFEAALVMAKTDPSHALRFEGQFALMGYAVAGTRAQGRQARDARGCGPHHLARAAAHVEVGAVGAVPSARSLPARSARCGRGCPPSAAAPSVLSQVMT